jgi:hypothetical protein
MSGRAGIRRCARGYFFAHAAREGVLSMSRILLLCSMRDAWDDAVRPGSDQLFEQASDLLAMGYTRASGCISRQTIDAALTEACQAAGIWPRHPVTGKEMPGSTNHNRVERLTLTLRLADILSEEAVKLIRRASAYGNRAAHRYPFVPAQAATMIEASRRIRSLKRSTSQATA